MSFCPALLSNFTRLALGHIGAGTLSHFEPRVGRPHLLGKEQAVLAAGDPERAVSLVRVWHSRRRAARATGAGLAMLEPP